MEVATRLHSWGTRRPLHRSRRCNFWGSGSLGQKVCPFGVTNHQLGCLSQFGNWNLLELVRRVIPVWESDGANKLTPDLDIGLFVICRPLLVQLLKVADKPVQLYDNLP